MIEFEINELKFDERRLIPAIVIDKTTRQVLTLAYMNKESLKISLEKGLCCLYSRSRNCLWLKGETSGNYQHIIKITADFDKDALLISVEPDGPACHKGTFSCFSNPLYLLDKEDFTLNGLLDLVNYLILAFAKGEASSFFLSLDSFSSLLCRLFAAESDALSTGVLVRSTQVQVISPKPASRIVFALFTSRSSL